MRPLLSLVRAVVYNQPVRFYRAKPTSDRRRSRDGKQTIEIRQRSTAPAEDGCFLQSKERYPGEFVWQNPKVLRLPEITENFHCGLLPFVPDSRFRKIIWTLLARFGMITVEALAHRRIRLYLTALIVKFAIKRRRSSSHTRLN